MKKSSLVFLTLGAALLTMSGCGPKGDSASEGSDKAKEGDVELLVWEDQAKSDGIKDAIAVFEKENNVKIKLVEKAYAGQIEDLRLDGPAGTGADVITIPSDQIGTAVTEGLLKELDVADSTKEIFTDVALDSQMVDGKIYGLPKAVETQILFYNKDIISDDQLPKTLDEWYDYSKNITDNEKDKYGLIATLDQIYYAQGILKGYGGYIFGQDKDGNYKTDDIGLDNEGAIEGANVIKEFYDNKVLPSGLVGEQGTNVLDSLFTEGKAAAVISGPWSLAPYKEAGINYGVKELPMLSNGEHMGSFIGVKSYNVSSYSKHPEIAQKFVEFITNEENSKTRYEKTQEVPAVASLTNDPVVKESEGAAAIAAQSQHAELTPGITAMNSVWEPVDAALQTIATGKAEPKDALTEAVKQIKSAIAANQ